MLRHIMSAVDYSPSQFAYAYGKPTISGVLRSTPEDFQVDEVLGFEPDGQGEHFLLHIRKRNTNTEWLARQLAKFINVKSVDVSFAGLKDRNAVTTQWFSVRIPGLSEPDWQQFNEDDYQVLKAVRHGRKLRRGALQGNRFTITIRELQGNTEELEQRLNKIKAQGVPNYFGEQRFGHNGDNLQMANLMFTENKKIKNRQKRSMFISAARSYLFNLVCSARVEAENWNKAVAGDAMILSGSHSYFTADVVDDDILRRVAEKDIAPSGPLWGRGQLPTEAEAEQLEEDVLQPYSQWLAGLEHQGLKQERRCLWLPVNDFQWELSEQTLKLTFTLPAGSYATSVLRECVSYS